MSVGKYNPTVSASYARDQNWWERNGGGYGNGKNPDVEEDDDGYDSYGYQGINGPDRAGFTEMEYLTDGQWVHYSEGEEEYRYPLYDDVYMMWAGCFLGDLK